MNGHHTLPVVYAGAGETDDFAGIDATGKLALVRCAPQVLGARGRVGRTRCGPAWPERHHRSVLSSG